VLVLAVETVEVVTVPVAVVELSEVVTVPVAVVELTEVVMVPVAVVELTEVVTVSVAVVELDEVGTDVELTSEQVVLMVPVELLLHEAGNAALHAITQLGSAHDEAVVLPSYSGSQFLLLSQQ